MKSIEGYNLFDMRSVFFLLNDATSHTPEPRNALTRQVEAITSEYLCITRMLIQNRKLNLKIYIAFQKYLLPTAHHVQNFKLIDFTMSSLFVHVIFNFLKGLIHCIFQYYIYLLKSLKSLNSHNSKWIKYFYTHNFYICNVIV